MTLNKQDLMLEGYMAAQKDIKAMGTEWASENYQLQMSIFRMSKPDIDPWFLTGYAAAIYVGNMDNN